MKESLNYEIIRKRQLVANGVNVLGLFLIGVMCLCYSIFSSGFAELHIQPPFLDFPIFIGEILLAACLVLFLLKYIITPFPITPWFCVSLYLYGVWILVKAWHGYFTYGPLAFRNAALFYYPLFAFLTFHFFQREYFSQKSILFLLLIFVLTCTTINFSPYFLFPSIALFLTLLFKTQQRFVKIAGIVSLLFLYNPKAFLTDSKTALMGNLLAFLFIAIFLSIFYLKKRRFLIIISGCIVAVLILGLLKFGSKNQLKALASPLLLYNQFKQEDTYIKEKMKTFHAITLTPSLYNPNTIHLNEKIILNLKIDKTRNSEQETDLRNIEKRLKDREHLTRIAALKSIREICSIAISGFNANLGINEERKTAIASFNQDVKEAIEKITENLRAEREKFTEQFEAFWVSSNLKEINLTSEIEKIEEKFNDACRVHIGEIFDHLDERQKEILASRRKRVIKKITAEPRGNALMSVPVQSIRKPLDPTQVRQLSPTRPSEGSSTFLQDTMMAVQNLEQSTPAETAPSHRSLIEERGNMLFRLFIWRDMFVDLISNPWLIVTGMNFGKPQRSISNEIVIAAYGEWMRDGWITPHNSFFNMVYRGGITGVFIIFCLLYALVDLIRQAVLTKSLMIIFLCSVIIYWMVISNFLVILEFPHYAIPFWSLLGMIVAYAEAAKFPIHYH